MKKFRFLCTHHHRWLSDRPEKAINNWSQCYRRSLHLAEDRKYREAISHAGSAFETSEILLDQRTATTATDILRFTNSGVLLAELLHSVGYDGFARTIVDSTMIRIERLLILGVEKKTALTACSRLLMVEEKLALGATEEHIQVFTPAPPEQIH
jgi:hypothetical protein